MKPFIPFTLRPSTVEDAPLFYRLIDRTMRGFIVETWGGWDDERIRRESRVDSASPNAQVIQIGTMAAGVWLVERSPSYIQLEQIYLFPEYQKLGIGTALLRQLMAESDRTDIPVRLRVIAVNPAKQFYDGLGFVVTEAKPEFFGWSTKANDNSTAHHRLSTLAPSPPAA
ncbi:MAG: GNAT family N-acetyltransferase [Alkalinema sp. RU_4_3]|nr:GNAT family N-acetyltransferase [Alkalinema sp. RU_4_3]